MTNVHKDKYRGHLRFVNTIQVTPIYIPVRSAGGGLANNFTPQQGVDCLWTQRRGERRGVGGGMESVKGWRRCLKFSVLSPIIKGQLQNIAIAVFFNGRLGTGDNRDNNLKRRGGHERRTNGFAHA